ncbi:MAG: hypothetical protein WC470_02745 [Candidatus Paceibacterota bacterium]
MRYCAECKRVKLFNFCIFCFKKTINEFVLKAGTGDFKSTFNRTSFTHKRPGFKKFLSKVITGWMPTKGKNSKKYPEGVFVHRIIDRVKNWYEEKIIDMKTGDIIESKKEPLSQHKSKKRN